MLTNRTVDRAKKYALAELRKAQTDQDKKRCYALLNDLENHLDATGRAYCKNCNYPYFMHYSDAEDQEFFCSADCEQDHFFDPGEIDCITAFKNHRDRLLFG